MILLSSPITFTVSDDEGGLDALPGYPPENIINPRIGKPWRNTADLSVNLDLPGSMTVKGVMLQDVNVSKVNIDFLSSIDYDVNTIFDRYGRGCVYLSVEKTTSYVEVDILMSDVVTRDAYINVGAAYVFAESDTITPDPEYGTVEQHAKPALADRNAREYPLIQRTGPARTMIDLVFSTAEGDDPAIIERRLGDRSIGGVAIDPADICMPVKIVNSAYRVNRADYARDDLVFSVQEVV